MLAITDYFRKVFSERSHNKSFRSSVFCPLFGGVTEGLELEGIGGFHCNYKISYYLHNSSIYYLNLLIFQNLLQKDLYQNLYNGTTQRVSSFCSGSIVLKYFLLHWRFLRSISSNWQDFQIFRNHLVAYSVGEWWLNIWQF